MYVICKYKIAYNYIITSFPSFHAAHSIGKQGLRLIPGEVNLSRLGTCLSFGSGPPGTVISCHPSHCLGKLESEKKMANPV